MKRSPMDNAAHGSRSYDTRHMYNWKSHENASSRGYHFAEGNSSQRFPANDAQPQTFNDNFIPLNVSTPMTRHGKHNVTNRYSFTGGSPGRGSPGSGWSNNYRSNYHATPRSNYNNRYSSYKHSPKQFYGQKKKNFKGAHRQVNVSAYVDINSFLEDPWEELVKKLNDSKDTNKSEGSENELPSNSKLADRNSIESSESKLSKDSNLGDLQCSQENKNDDSIDTSFEMQNTDCGQISKVKSLVKSTISDVCSNQDSLNESTCNVNDKVCGATQEKNIHPSAFLIDTDQKDI